VQIETKLQEGKPIRFQVFFSLFSTGHHAPSYGATVLHHLIVTARTRSRHGVAIGSFSRIFFCVEQQGAGATTTNRG
jgi:hypothetical protein